MKAIKKSGSEVEFCNVHLPDVLFSHTHTDTTQKNNDIVTCYARRL